jgi:hypothetical protein
MRDFVLHLTLCCTFTPVLLSAQYSGGSAAGVTELCQAAIRLDGLPLDKPFNGGYANGEVESFVAAVGLSGEVRQSMVAGGVGRGDRLADGILLMLDGVGLAASFRGGPGRGERDGPEPGMTLGGERGSAAFAGAGGHGETRMDENDMMLAGEMLDVAFAGDEGRGETEADAPAEILDCSHYAVWIGLVSTAWADPANWQCNELPHRYSDVIIPGSAPNFPQITVGPVEIRNLHLKANSSLQALTALLRVLGGPQ